MKYAQADVFVKNMLRPQFLRLRNSDKKIHAYNYTFNAWKYAVSAMIAQEKYKLRVV